MTLFSPGTLSPAQIIALTQQRLTALRDSLNAVDQLYEWLVAQPDADLVTGLGMDAGDLSAVRSAMADAHAFWQLYTSGTIANTYTIPGYTFGNSQRRVIGPS